MIKIPIIKMQVSLNKILYILVSLLYQIKNLSTQWKEIYHFGVITRGKKTGTSILTDSEVFSDIYNNRWIQSTTRY
jgi:hypothetical protein